MVTRMTKNKRPASHASGLRDRLTIRTLSRRTKHRMMILTMRTPLLKRNGRFKQKKNLRKTSKPRKSKSVKN